MNILLKPILAVGNFFVRRLLRSRLHWLLSHEVVMLEITGRKSGRLYLVPVNYRSFDGGVAAMTYRRRKWWLNLRGVDEIHIWLRGRRVAARVELVTDDYEAISRGLVERNWVRKAVANTNAKESLLIRLHVSTQSLYAMNCP
jgi:deazaflavin-dependent oxidoreductase (nitroreductase family)